MTADWVLKARPRVTTNYHRGSGAAVAQAATTPQAQIEFTIFSLGSNIVGVLAMGAS